MSTEKDDEKDEFVVRCHCGRLQGRFKCSSLRLSAWDCNCTDCLMRGNVHTVVPQQDLTLDMSSDDYEKATILYQWGTKIAVRRFCKTCGVLPWYVPRSNPDSYGIAIKCVDWTKGGTRQSPNIIIEQFDGLNWEDTMKKLSSK
jgi:hypothetical protein